MQLLPALGLLVGLVLLATVVGLGLRRSSGRLGAAPAQSDPVRPADLGVDVAFGSAATLVQFSTEFCAKCPATRRLLSEIATSTAGVRHIDLDVTDDVALASRFNILQTPTTLVLDGNGRQVARIGGPPRRSDLEQELAQLVAADQGARTRTAVSTAPRSTAPRSTAARGNHGENR